MRSLFLWSILLVACFPIWAQVETPSNSFEKGYAIANPALHYKYDTVTQTHNYSGNWDLDGDGKKDQISFVGMGGAHLYYYLRIRLSSNHLIQNFRFIQSDFPILPPDSIINASNFLPHSNDVFFAVFHHQKHPTIFVSLDEPTFLEHKKTLLHHGIHTKKVLISIRKNKVIFEDYTEGK